MSQRMIRRLCVLVVLALSLAFAVPGRADAGPLNGPAGLWRWVENFLQERLVLLRRAEPALGPQERAQPSGLTKEGGCKDPNGCPAGMGSGSSGGG
jgi:hypothetical protein